MIGSRIPKYRQLGKPKPFTAEDTEEFPLNSRNDAFSIDYFQRELYLAGGA
jgi:hypothetical protein